MSSYNTFPASFKAFGNLYGLSEGGDEETKDSDACGRGYDCGFGAGVITTRQAVAVLNPAH